MNKKLVAIITSLSLVSLICIGCSSSSDNGDSNSTTANTSSSQSDKKNPMADMFKDVGLYGEVSDITGNLIKVKVIEKPDINNFQNGTGKKNKQDSSNSDNSTKKDDSSTNQGGYDGQKSGGGRQKKYTGEEKEITIPSGIDVVTYTRDSNGMSESKININEIKKGDTLLVSYGSDGTTISKVVVQKASNGNSGGFGNGQRKGGN